MIKALKNPTPTHCPVVIMRFLLAVLFLLVAHDDTFAKPKPAPSPKPNPEPWHVFLNGQRPGMGMGGMGMHGGIIG